MFQTSSTFPTAFSHFPLQTTAYQQRTHLFARLEQLGVRTNGDEEVVHVGVDSEMQLLANISDHGPHELAEVGWRQLPTERQSYAPEVTPVDLVDEPVPYIRMEPKMMVSLRNVEREHMIRLLELESERLQGFHLGGLIREEARLPGQIDNQALFVALMDDKSVRDGVSGAVQTPGFLGRDFLDGLQCKAILQLVPDPSQILWVHWN